MWCDVIYFILFFKNIYFKLRSSGGVKCQTVALARCVLQGAVLPWTKVLYCLPITFRFRCRLLLVWIHPFTRTPTHAHASECLLPCKTLPALLGAVQGWVYCPRGEDEAGIEPPTVKLTHALIHFSISEPAVALHELFREAAGGASSRQGCSLGESPVYSRPHDETLKSWVAEEVHVLPFRSLCWGNGRRQYCSVTAGGTKW